MLIESKYYRAIYEPSYIEWNKEELDLKRSLEALSVFRVRQPLPIVLAIVSEYFSGNLKLKNAKKYLGYIESFHFIHTAVTSQRSSGGLSSYYAKKARELRQADTESKKVEILNNIKNKLGGDKPGAVEFKLAFEDLKYSEKHTKNKKLIQYILTKIDKFQRSGTPIDYSMMTIEHVGSQSDLNISADKVANIGNLVFVSSRDNNEVLKNHSFEIKNEVFNKDYSHLDKCLLEAVKWTGSEISKRGSILSDIAYTKVWVV